MSTDAIIVKQITQREREVILLLAKGLTNREVAEELYLAESTVKWYIRELNSKLHTRKRREIVKCAKELGLLNDTASNLTPQMHNLPHQNTPFIGRDAELDALQKIVKHEDVRLLTILAPGGMGKTRIALELAEQQLGNFQHGVYFVPLQAVTEVTQIMGVIAQHIGYQLMNDGRNDQEQVLNYIHNKHMLLVLDNFEELLAGVDIVTTILKTAPDVVILVTSREKLNVSHETTFMLKGMAHPDWETPENALEYDGVRLLVRTAQRAKPNWKLTTDNIDFVARICRLTDGMPLGILLALSWLDVLTLEEIAEEIQKSADFLDTEMHDVPQRQRSIRAVFDAMWKCLKPKEQEAFMRLSVFRGGFTREAAQEIAGAGIALLQALMSKALLMRNQDGRYDLHELLRQYAEQALQTQGDESSTRQAHFAYYSQQLIDLYPNLYNDKQLETAEIIEQEYENLRIAWDYGVTNEQINVVRDMIYSFDGFYAIRWQGGEWKDMIKEAFQTFKHNFADHPSFVVLLRTYTEYQIHDGSEKVTNLEYTLKLARRHNTKRDIALCLYELSISYTSVEHYEEAWRVIDEAEQLFQKLDDTLYIGLTLLSKTRLITRERGNEVAEPYYQKPLDIFRQLGYSSGISIILNNLGVSALESGDLQAFMQHITESLEIAYLTSDNAAIALRTRNLGIGHLLAGDLGVAHQYYTSALNLYRELNLGYQIIFSLQFDALLLWIDGQETLAREQILEALQLVEELPQPESLRPMMQLYLSYFDGDYHEARASGIKVLESWGFRCPSTYTYFDLLVFGLSLSHIGDDELSVILLSVIDSTKRLPKGFDKMALFERWSKRVKTNLSAQKFNEAWERGQLMDRDMVSQFLKESFDNESD